MLPVSLDCPFLIAPSVFTNVYVEYAKEAKKAGFVFGGGAFARVNISYVLFCALGEGLG